MKLRSGYLRRFSILLGSVAGIFILILLLSTPIMGLFNLGTILSPGGIYGAAYDSIHRSQTLTVEGLSDTVTVIRDEWGIPHIYGKTREDVSFALGYVHGIDRLFQMEMTSRTSMGHFRISRISSGMPMISAARSTCSWTILAKENFISSPYELSIFSASSLSASMM